MASHDSRRVSVRDRLAGVAWGSTRIGDANLLDGDDFHRLGRRCHWGCRSAQISAHLREPESPSEQRNQLHEHMFVVFLDGGSIHLLGRPADLRAGRWEQLVAWADSI